MLGPNNGKGLMTAVWKNMTSKIFNIIIGEKKKQNEELTKIHARILKKENKNVKKKKKGRCA